MPAEGRNFAALALAGATLLAGSVDAAAQDAPRVGDRVYVSVGEAADQLGDTLFTVGPEATTGTAHYDAGGRRDPFVPLTAAGRSRTGPRFESMKLTGVFLGAPGSSLVVLEDQARRGHFLRVGETLGDARLVEILPRSAVFEIRQYGAVRREVLELERSEE